MKDHPLDLVIAGQLERRLGQGRVRRHVPLAPYTTFRIGGPADFFYVAANAEELRRAVVMVRDLGVPFFLLGRGANVLVSDDGFRGLVILNRANAAEIRQDGRLFAESGAVVFPDLINLSVEHGLGGLHHYVGIPGTVGGALWQNLHFLSPDRSRTVFVSEVVEAVELLRPDGSVVTVKAEEMAFGYDVSALHTRADIALAATFSLAAAEPARLREEARANLAWRNEKHPDLWLYPSAGSIFRKIEGVGAGRLIDQVGLRGYVHPSGRAAFFERHANVIVNLGGATAADVHELIDLARSRVLHQLGYDLVPEIGFVGLR